MYLSDEETQKLMQNCLKFLAPNGILFARESCDFACGKKLLPYAVLPNDLLSTSGNLNINSNNPTFYRTAKEYEVLFNIVGKQKFNVVKKKHSETYAKV